jgi:hypothetical protein
MLFKTGAHHERGAEGRKHMMRASKLLSGAIALAFIMGLSACDDEPAVVEPGEDAAPEIQLSTPAGGEAVQPGADLEITWTATDDNEVAGVDLSYSHGGGSGTVIATGVTESSYTWTVPDNQLVSVKVKATAVDDAGQTGDDESDIFAIVEHSARGYVTSNVCRNCHINYYNDMINSGHPYKLNAVVNGQPPEYPSSTVPNTPQGVTWDDIAYVIGGYGWKARFITADSGWIMTNGMDGVDVQYNLPRDDLGVGSEWVSYHATDTERKPYNNDCGPCHTTGWQTLAENGGVHQDGLIGIEGTWEETGITCEACHGSGADHVASQSSSDITVDDASAACGDCHRRGDDDDFIEASGGFIRHHEQYQEWKAGAHWAFAQCNECHDPHIGTRYGNGDAGGILKTCEDCHTRALNHAPVSCESCHMARATKSARAIHSFEGDVRTHLFRINTDGTKTKDDMFFTPAGSTKLATNPWVTLDFACYSCHTDPITSEGGGGPTLTMAELAARAAVIHQ